MVGVRTRVRVGLGVSELSIADCRYAIPGDRVPIAGTGYTTFLKKCLTTHCGVTLRCCRR